MLDVRLPKDADEVDQGIELDDFEDHSSVE